MGAEAWTAGLTGLTALVSFGAAVAAWKAAGAARDQVAASLRPQIAPLQGNTLASFEDVYRNTRDGQLVGPEVIFSNIGPGTAVVKSARLRWARDRDDAPTGPWTSINGASSVPVVPAGAEGSVLFLFTSGDAANTHGPLVGTNKHLRMEVRYTDVDGTADYLVVFGFRSSDRGEGLRRVHEVLGMRTDAPLDQADVHLPSTWADA